MMPRIIAIAGASGSGKTTLALELEKKYGAAHAELVSLDDFYKDQSHLAMEARKLTNYDVPTAFDFDYSQRVLRDLKLQPQVQCPKYDYATHNRMTETKILLRKTNIINEGIMALVMPELRSVYDVMIYVDTNPAICRERRLKRDVAARGRTYEEEAEKYDRVVAPMFIEHVLPTKQYADIVVDVSAVIDGVITFDVSAIVEEIELILQAKQTQAQRIQTQMKLFGSKIVTIPVPQVIQDIRSPSPTF
jgi:uridine kinase